MTRTTPLKLRGRRVTPPPGICRTELRVLSECIEYQGDRDVIGTTLLDAACVGRQAYVWTLADGEHLLLLLQAQRFCYWEATREPLEQLHARATDWLTEPAVEARPARAPRGPHR